MNEIYALALIRGLPERKASQMKMHRNPYWLSIALAGFIAIVGCDKAKEGTGTAQPSTTAPAEITDASLTTSVKTALHQDEAIKSFDITVVVTKGDVRLTGFVDSQGQIDQAIKVARSIEGVHSIHDELTIKK